MTVIERTALPRTDDLRHPVRWPLHSLRAPMAAAGHRRWDITQVGADKVPATGPVVLVANHIGFLDGPLMAILGPRPVHALTKRELYEGPLGAFLVFAGQIPVTREETDPLAVRTAVRVLREGGVVGVFPESTRGTGEVRTAAGGAAYLAMVTGAPIVPLAFLGTRLPRTDDTFPPAGTRIVMTYGDPMPVERCAWPRRQADVRALTERLRRHLVATVEAAVAATGIDLPGPVPENADPDLGRTEKDEP
ncbi:MAG: lysophospholipid acyltransferase family protein [Marmoricola sp.]